MTKLTKKQVAEIQQTMNELKARYGCDMIVMAFHRQENVEYFRVAEYGFYEGVARYLLKCLSDGIDTLNQRMRHDAERN